MSTPSAPLLVWFRNDLRISDHPALHAAAAAGVPVVPVYLHTPEAEGRWRRGGASRWWLHHALADLDEALRGKGSRLVLRSGSHPGPLLDALLRETGATAVYWNRRYEPAGVEVDTRLEAGIPSRSFPGGLLREPHEVKTGSGDFYKVFTPFHKALLALGPPSAPLPPPRVLLPPARWPASETLTDWNLLPSIPWDRRFHENARPTREGAREASSRFFDEAVGRYKQDRDIPAERGTSRLSPYLHFGQVSPRALWHEMEGAPGAEAWLRQLAWRDFAAHLLFHLPTLDREPMQPKFAHFPWQENPGRFRAWRRGLTGYPIVDAGMRELWATGWMHNRVRMVTASFLVKDLLLPWQQGASWFWETLVDADLANNSFGWQWTAGCGADAAPYFRIFNPVLQSRKFDPAGAYIRRWIPELQGLDDALIHAPWLASRPPSDYPPPIVDHAVARDLALEALASLSA